MINEEPSEVDLIKQVDLAFLFFDDMPGSGGFYVARTYSPAQQREEPRKTTNEPRGTADEVKEFVFMAFTRKMLAALGVEADKIEEIITAHTEVTSDLKSQIDELKATSADVEKLKTELANAKTELDELKKADYKAKYEALTADNEKLKKEYDDYKNEQTAKATKAAKEKAVREYAKSKGNISDANLEIAMRGMRDEIDAAEIDEKGSIKDKKPFDTLFTGVYADLYTKTTTSGTVTPTPPEQGGGKAVKTKAEIMQIKDAGERQAAIKDAIQNGSTEFKI